MAVSTQEKVKEFVEDSYEQRHSSLEEVFQQTEVQFYAFLTNFYRIC